MKKKKQTKFKDKAELALQEAMDRTLKHIVIPEVFLNKENKLKKS